MTTDKIIIERTDDDFIYTVGNIDLLSTICNFIKSNQFEELAKSILNKNKTENSIEFYINKQSAYHNKFHIIDENMSVLDDIRVFIKTENPDDVIYHIIN